MAETRGPKFRMWCESRLRLMHLPKSEWALFRQRADELQGVDLGLTPVASFANNPQLEGAILSSPSSGVFELDLLRYRGDQHASTERYATYRFRVYEEFPSEFDFGDIVNSATTQADEPLLSFVDEQVWFLPVDKSAMGERYASLPSTALGVFRGGLPE